LKKDSSLNEKRDKRERKRTEEKEKERIKVNDMLTPYNIFLYVSNEY